MNCRMCPLILTRSTIGTNYFPSFETDVLEKESYQDNVVVNDTEQEVPYTRIIEHKYFEFGKQPFPTNILLNSNRGMSILFDQ